MDSSGITDEELAAVLAALLEEGSDEDAARLLFEMVRGSAPDLEDDEAARIAAEVTAWLVG